MIDIWFEVHAQTYHNAADLASGHYDVALTNHGRGHAQSVLRASPAMVGQRDIIVAEREVGGVIDLGAWTSNQISIIIRLHRLRLS